MNSNQSGKPSSLNGSMIDLSHKTIDSYSTLRSSAKSKEAMKKVLPKQDTLKKFTITNDKMRASSKSPPRQQSPVRQCGHNYKDNNVRCTLPVQQKTDSEKTILQANQEMIIELLSNIYSKIDSNQQLFDKTQINIESVKDLIKNNSDDIKNNIIEVSIDNSMRTINKLQELLKH
jgi:hypothetical protein